MMAVKHQITLKLLLLSAFISSALGVAVVMPDYIGLRRDGISTGFTHPYLVAQPTAIAALDAIRASYEVSSMMDRQPLFIR